LVISAGASSVRGLTVQAFRGTGITLTTKGGNVVAGNNGPIAVSSGDGNTIGGLTPADQNIGGVIGVGGNYNTIVGNLATGVVLLGMNNQVGGTTAAARNVISGNAKYGVEIGDSGNRVEGN